MIAEFSIFPVGKGEHLSQYVAPMIKIVKESGLPYKLTAMATIVEGDADQVFDLVKKCHAKMMEDSNRVVATIRIDDFKGRTGRLAGKIKSVEEKLGEEVEK